MPSQAIAACGDAFKSSWLAPIPHVGWPDPHSQDNVIFGHDLDHSADYEKQDVPSTAGAAGGGGHGAPRDRINALDDTVGVLQKHALQPHMRTEVDMLIFGRDQDSSNQCATLAVLPPPLPPRRRHSLWPPACRYTVERSLHGYAGPPPPLPPPRRVPRYDKWEPFIADGRRVHKTLPGTSGVGTRVQRVRRIGTNPNNIWREGDADEYAISNQAAAALQSNQAAAASPCGIRGLALILCYSNTLFL
jgi:hypothetical protein